MYILITGSRDASLPMRSKAEEVVRWCQKKGHSVIVGDAEGIDAKVRQMCQLLNVPCRVFGAYGRYRQGAIGGQRFRADFKSYPERDFYMAQACDMCVAIWNGKSRGTKITCEAAKKLGKRVIVRVISDDLEVYHA